MKTTNILDQLGVSLEEGGVHAGFLETSILLAGQDLRGFDMPSAMRGFVGDAMARVRELASHGQWSIADISPIGVLGDPTKANAEAGLAILKSFLQAWKEMIIEGLEHA